jgi:uncharacterized protein (DUF488 family)
MWAEVKKEKIDLTIFTIGHSTHSLDEFIAMLQGHEVTLVADVRTVPRSRHNPQFNPNILPNALKNAGLHYTHLPGLGGWRRVQLNSPNQGWRSPAFQGFADYMLTSEFEAHLKNLIELARREQPVLMCAEALPWRCHRSLIADSLVVQGISVIHIMGRVSAQSHRLHPMARVEGTLITYPVIS